MTSPLEPEKATLQHWLTIVSQLVTDHQERTASEPAMGAVGEAGHRRARALSQPILETPMAGGMEAISALLEEASGVALNTTAGGYLAYVPGGGLITAGMADLIAASFNRFTGLSGAAPAFVRFEADVLTWLAREFGYGPQARGLFTSGGSQANLSALIAARQTRFGDTGDFRTATVYTSAQAHHSVSKSVRLAGLPSKAMRIVPVDDEMRMCPRELEQMIRRDVAAGCAPMAVVAAAGTTNTGAVDPLPELVAVSQATRTWLHIDGAYGGAFVLCPEGRELLRGIEGADSITFDPHKGLFLPYGTGCLLVKDGRALLAAHDADATYLQDFDTFGHDGAPPSPASYGPELSRPYRGLRLWLSLMLFGAGPFRRALSDKLMLARRFHDALSASDAPIEVLHPPQTSAVGFRLVRRPGEALAVWNARNAEWMTATNAKQRVHLSSTTLPSSEGPVFTLRVCVLSFRTHTHHIEHCLEDLLGSVPA
ncbi:MAG: pyridoxal phosphate-dependent decarboxylase family protein [Myxococcota bacterium]